MCLIVDANRASLVFGQPGHRDSKPIFAWLARGGALIYGGALKLELYKLAAARSVLLELQRQGRAIDADAIWRTEISRRTAEIARSGSCRSDDPHVIALAQITGCRRLCSDDTDAIADFRDPKLLSGPRGSVYRKARHRKLLRHTRGCPRYRK